MAQIKQRDEALNQAILKGEIVERFGEFYHPDVVMVEGDGSTTEGFEANLEREKQFFGSVETIHDAGIEETAVSEGDGVSFARERFDLSFKDGNRMKIDEIALRKWQDGKVVYERFFYNA